MRSHGIPNFPDPTFQNNTVTFNTRVAHRHELFPVQERVGDLPEADPGGPALQQFQRFVTKKDGDFPQHGCKPLIAERVS